MSLIKLFTKENVTAFSISVLFFIPTLFFGNEKWYLLLPIFCVFRFYKDLLIGFQDFKKNIFGRKYIGLVWFPLALIVLSSFNYLINGNETSCLRDFFLPVFFLPLVILSAIYISNKIVIRYLILLIILEILFGCVEYIIGYRSIFLGNEATNIIESRNLLYDSHVYGLSTNSSVLGLKIFIAYLLLEWADFKSKMRWVIYLFLFFGLLISFSRSVIILVLILHFLNLITYLFKRWKGKIQMKKKDILFFYVFNVVIIVFLFSPLSGSQMSRGGSTESSLEFGLQDKKLEFTDFQFSCAERNAVILKQGNEIDTNGFITKSFLRTISGINTSGRGLIWLNYVDFINENFWFGNGSQKAMFITIDQENEKLVLLHAHNSFLEMIATNGILLTILYLVFYSFVWRRRNLYLLLVILGYSLLQYGVFWGYSILDVIFVAILLKPTNCLLIEKD